MIAANAVSYSVQKITPAGEIITDAILVAIIAAIVFALKRK